MNYKLNIISGLTMALMMAAILVGCNKDNETAKDEIKPVISNQGITANPVNCQVYHKGDTIPFFYLFTDDTELGSYNIEVHDNSDHHSHSTESNDHEGGECEHHEEHEHEANEQHWVYNQSFEIPAGLRSYEARVKIPIPEDVAEGDYHFMIRLTDKAGWQQLKALAIIIED